MTAQLLELTDQCSPLSTAARVWDADINCNLVIAHPHDEPGLWSQYVDGAVRSYRRHGVQSALDLDILRSGTDTALFFAVVDTNERVVAGVRAKGPLLNPDESHAVTEWAGQPGLAAVRKMITDRIPFGILEMKAAWTDGNPERARSHTIALARSGFHSMERMDVQFCMATAAAHVLESWRSSGGVVAAHIPPTPYPDTRYQTKMMWWDRRTFTKHADPAQVSKMFREAIVLAQPLDERDEAELRYSGGV